MTTFFAILATATAAGTSALFATTLSPSSTSWTGLLGQLGATDISAAIRGEAMLGRVAGLRNTVEVLSQRLEKAGALDEDSLILRNRNRQQAKIAGDEAVVKAEDVKQAVEDA